MSFSFLDLILFTGVIQGIFLIFSLQFISQKNKNANNVLSIIIALATFIFAGKMITYQINASWVLRASLLTDCTIYLFGPLLYIYFRVLVFKEQPRQLLHFKHFIFSFLLFLFFCWTMTLNTPAFIAALYTTEVYIIFLLVELAAVASLIIYSVLSYKIVRHLKDATEQTVYTRQIARFINFIVIGISVVVVCWSVAIVEVYVFKVYDFLISYKLIWICMATFLFIVGYFSFTQPEIMRLHVPKKIKSKSKDRLNQEEINRINKKLQQLIDDEQVFMDAELSLKMLAKKVDTSANNLSWLLNSVYRKTFYEYINEYRIHAFLGKIREGEHKKQTLLAIAMDVGFNSKSTFNKSFKSFMNDTPSSYIQRMYS